MRVSQYFSLGRAQGSLEFVDVDIAKDVPLFIDPGAIRLLGTTMAHECASLLQNFFQRVLDAIGVANHQEATDLLAGLHELNETRLGFSAGGARGHGMGAGLAADLHARLQMSRAVATGLLQDLEETALFVPGIDRDIISDIVTNIIFAPLADFTVTMCQKYGIATQPGIAYYRWDRHYGWMAATAGLPVVAGHPLVLVPRAFVRRRQVFSAQGYYDHYILPYLQQEHLDANSELVRILRSGARRPPYKKVLRAKHPDVKGTNTEFTAVNPDLLADYRRDAEKDFSPIGQQELSAGTGSETPDFDALLVDVLACDPGGGDATKYQHAVEKLLTALFYPALDNPVLEQKQNNGRKRIDIDYENQATEGLFYWMHAVNGVHCAYVPVECKNYTEDPANPEIDQLLGRLTIQRGHLGILCYRTSTNKDLIRQRCKDAALNGQGYVLTLDDGDLKAFVEERKQLPDGQGFVLLSQIYRALVT